MACRKHLGSCSLHVVHGAFQTGAQQTGWNIDSLLRSLYNLFHDAPARAEDFVNITGSTQFPRKFCSTNGWRMPLWQKEP